MLHHLKSKEDWLLHNKPDEYHEKDKYAKEHVYEAIKDNIYYFKNSHLPQNFDINLEVSKYSLQRMSLDDLLELEERFKRTATGVFGMYYDNCAGMYLTDLFGRQYVMSCYKNASNSTYELTVWDFQGVMPLLKIKTKSNKLSTEEYAKISNIEKIYEEHLQNIENRKQRIQQIKEHKDYIQVKNKTSGYAHFKAEAWVRKDIPIQLTKEEIAEYSDGFGHNFGWTCDNPFNDDSGEWDVYRVRINTD